MTAGLTKVLFAALRRPPRSHPFLELRRLALEVLYAGGQVRILKEQQFARYSCSGKAAQVKLKNCLRKLWKTADQARAHRLPYGADSASPLATGDIAAKAFTHRWNSMTL